MIFNIVNTLRAVVKYNRLFKPVGSSYDFWNHKSKTFKKNRRKALKRRK